MSNVIDAVFKLTDNFSQPLSKCMDSLTEASKMGTRTRKTISKIGDSLTKTGTLLTASVTTPLSILGKKSYSTWADVDNQLNLVQATMRESDESFDVLKDKVLEVAAASVYDMEDAAEASLAFARAGYKAGDAANLLQPAMDLAVSTGTDLTTVTSGLSSIMKAYGAATEDAAEYASVMTLAQAQANITTEDLFDAFTNAGSAAKNYGFDLADVATFVGALGDMYIPGATAGTALKSGFASLISPKKTDIKAVDEATKSLWDENGAMKSLVEVQQIMHDALSGLSQLEKDSALKTLFGKTQYSNMAAFFDTDPAIIQQYENDLRSISDTYAESTAASQMNEDASALERLSSAFNTFKYKVGETLNTVVTPFIDKITDMMNAFTFADEDTQQFIVKIAGIAAAIGPVLVVFGKLIKFGMSVADIIAKLSTIGSAASGAAGAASGAAGAAGGAGGILGTLSSALPVIGIIIAVIAAVVTHLDEFKATLAAVADNCSGLFSRVGESFSGLVTAIQPVITLLTSIFEGFSQLLISVFDGLLNSVGFTLFVDGLSRMISGVIDILTGVIEFLTGVFTLDWDTCWQGIYDTFNGIIQLIIGAIESTVGVLGSLASAVKGVGETVGGWVSGAASWVGDKLAGNASGTNNWSGGLTRVNEQGGEIMNLPNGTQIIPHDLSRNMIGNSGSTVTITGNTFTVREQADIDRITDALVRKMYRAQANMGTA